jgi:ribA/ribD-fused uncharacterized protein
MSDIHGFFGEHRWLSNFWPCEVELDGDLYATVEHAYQAAKTDELWERERIRQLPSPSHVKALSKVLHKRKDWDDLRLQVMEYLLRQKFNKPEFKEKLLATGLSHLEETNTWGDDFWGVCNGKGENHLGNLLMKIRTEFQEVP